MGHTFHTPHRPIDFPKVPAGLAVNPDKSGRSYKSDLRGNPEWLGLDCQGGPIRNGPEMILDCYGPETHGGKQSLQDLSRLITGRSIYIHTHHIIHSFYITI